jgi:hypothetical protein
LSCIKFFLMDLKSLSGLAIVSQWTLFLGLGLVIFGWVEKKEKLSISGLVCFILLEILSLWTLLAKNVIIPETITNPIPKEVKILSFFKLAAYFSAVSLISLLLNIFKLRYYKLSVYLVVILGLMLFFMVFNILQTPTI